MNLEKYLNMSVKNNKQQWEQYRNSELAIITPMLEQLGFQLETEQPHTTGERYLMQAVTTESGRKLILIGRRKQDDKRVVIKATSDSDGIHELEYEQIRKNALQKINFAYNVFLFPKEILFTKQKGTALSIQEFIENECPFLERDTPEQFKLMLGAFKIQEGAHATTYKHKKLIKNTFGEKNSIDYIKDFKIFRDNTSKNLPADTRLHNLLGRADQILQANTDTIEQYCGFLTHTDFVPHNFRITEDKVYFLDQSSIRFGNKYEGWGRFLNFMTLYNQQLEEAFLFYIKNNRIKEEYLSLKLMRIYRLGEIIWFYTSLLEKTTGDLHTLTKLRVQFWAEVLKAVIEDKQVSKNTINEYKHARDNLRSEEEKKRQIGLH